MTSFGSAPLEDDDFDELYGVTVPRVDLVSKGANGMPILIAKSAADQHGLISPATIDQLLKGEPMSPRPPSPSPIRKAKASSQLAVYDAQGNLVGIIDESDLTPIADASSPQKAAAQQPAAAPQAAPVAQAPVPASEEVAKSIHGALRGASYSNVGPVMKGARSGGDCRPVRRADQVCRRGAPAWSAERGRARRRPPQHRLQDPERSSYPAGQADRPRHRWYVMTNLTPGTPVFVQHAHGSADGFDLGFVTAYLGSGGLNGVPWDDVTAVVLSTSPPSEAVTPIATRVRVWSNRAAAAGARMPAGAGYLSASLV